MKTTLDGRYGYLRQLRPGVIEAIDLRTGRTVRLAGDHYRWREIHPPVVPRPQPGKESEDDSDPGT